MPPDPHLFDGEGERQRRYGRLLIDPVEKEMSLFAHDSFYQDKKFDVLYGDIHRNFPSITANEYSNNFFQKLIIESYLSLPLAPNLKMEPFEVSVHMLRIQATPNSMTGRPAPEGIHRDGYHFGSIHLMRREILEGARNNIYDLNKKMLDHCFLLEPMDSIYFDDQAIYHGVSPFSQTHPEKIGTRDILILLYQPLGESPQKHTPIEKVLTTF